MVHQGLEACRGYCGVTRIGVVTAEAVAAPGGDSVLARKIRALNRGRMRKRITLGAHGVVRVFEQLHKNEVIVRLVAGLTAAAIASTPSGDRPDLGGASAKTRPPRAGTVKSHNAPPNVPNGERAAARVATPLARIIRHAHEWSRCVRSRCP